MDKAKEKFDKVIGVVAEDMSAIRVGGAKASMVEGIEAEVYENQRMKLMELASITAPDPTQIVISPWDKTTVRAIEKAILISDLKFTPNVSGEIIRIIIPPLTEERRQDYVKLAHQKLESGKVLLRNARQEIKEDIAGTEGEAGVSEDDVKSQLEALQRLVEEYTVKLEAMAKEKQEEIMKL